MEIPKLCRESIGHPLECPATSTLFEQKQVLCGPTFPYTCSTTARKLSKTQCSEETSADGLVGFWDFHGSCYTFTGIFNP